MIRPAPYLCIAGAVVWTLVFGPCRVQDAFSEMMPASENAGLANDETVDPALDRRAPKRIVLADAPAGSSRPVFASVLTDQLALAAWIVAVPLLCLLCWRRRMRHNKTCQERIEKALSVNQELLETVFNITEDSILLLDDTFHVLMTNSIGAKRFGFEPETLLGEDILTYTEEPVASSRRAHLLEALESGQTVRFSDNRAGRTYDVALYPILQAPGKRPILAVYARDITAKLAVEAALREKQERLDKFFRLAPVVVAIAGRADDRILEINEAFTAISGFRRDEAIGRTLEDLSMWVRAGDRAAIEEIIRRDGLIRDFEVLLHFKDGRSATLLLSAIPLDAYEQPCLLAVMVDISGRKAMEEALRLAKDSAESANRAKSRFLSTMSHEIRTPMNTILGMVDVLRTTTLTERQEQFLRTLEVAGEALMALLTDILELSKIESGTLEIGCADFDPTEVCRQAMDILRPQAERKGLQLYCRVPELPVEGCYGDPDRLRQILVNLINNAIKFTDQGEIRVWLSRRTGLSDRDELLFSVADTGIGIAADKQRAIFEPFTQVDSSTTRSHGGSGLGLAISTMLAEGMGGRLWVESQPGHGSTFYCAVPADRRLRHGRIVNGIPALWPKSQQQEASSAWKSVLIVEDSEPNRLLYQLFLEKLPLTLSFSPSGADSLEQFAKRTFDAIIMDIHLPDIDGLTVIKEMRQREADTGRSRTPILVVTAYAFREESGSVFEAGCDALLTKPIQKTRFIEVLEKVLQRGEAKRFDEVACAWTKPSIPG